MRRSCGQVESLIGRPAGSLTHADSLVLEQHLVACDECRRKSDVTQSVRRTITQASSGLSERARERVLAAAFAATERPLPAQAQTSRWTQLGLGMVAAALLLLGTRFALTQRAPVVASREVAAEARPTPSRPSVPEAVEADLAWHETEQAETRQLAHARVELAPGTRVRFVARSRVLELASGRVALDVDASRGQSFEVRTQSFRVQVLGTQFAVTPERVEVRHGHVVVSELSGAVLADLTDGKAFVYSEGSAKSTAEVVAPSHRSAHAAGDAAARASVAQLLVQAREALGASSVERARALLQQVDRRAASRTERAEAATLVAECALVEHDAPAAIRTYLQVAERYRGLRAGENALFAAAQLSTREPREEQAARLLSRYLERYPQGRFADEAQARLTQLKRSGARNKD
ncbi:MAG: FecR protein [Myxococcaceae bacterium]|nr:FecR protein [Myxococcaceae bacterium]